VILPTLISITFKTSRFAMTATINQLDQQKHQADKICNILHISNSIYPRVATTSRIDHILSSLMSSSKAETGIS
jgi:hypothetical protein